MKINIIKTKQKKNNFNFKALIQSPNVYKHHRNEQAHQNDYDNDLDLITDRPHILSSTIRAPIRPALISVPSILSTQKPSTQFTEPISIETTSTTSTTTTTTTTTTSAPITTTTVESITTLYNETEIDSTTLAPSSQTNPTISESER